MVPGDITTKLTTKPKRRKSQLELLLDKNPRRWTSEDNKFWRQYIHSLSPEKQLDVIEWHRKKWRLPPLGVVDIVSAEDYRSATGFYTGSAYDELGWSPEARALYSHFIRRASLTREEDNQWRQGLYKRTVKCGIRGIRQWVGLTNYSIEKATKEMVEMKLIRIKKIDGETNIYTLEPPYVWCHYLRVQA
jgi:hypothetical protein